MGASELKGLMNILDVYAHVLPRGYYERFAETLQADDNPRISGYQPWPDEFPALLDLEQRWGTFEGIEGYRQVISPAVPPTEEVAAPGQGGELAKLANDEMAELVASHPDRFAGFAAALSLDDVDGAVAELERAVNELGALGALIYTNVRGRPIDNPEFAPVFDKAAELGKALWLHPTRGMGQPDFPTEERSRYGMWWAIAWPYETTIAMGRLVMSGLFKRNPDLVVITHHGGGMVPQFPDRVCELGLDEAVIESDNARAEMIGELKLFYADTVLSQTAVLRSTIDFFGLERTLFATDMPFGPPGLIQKRIDLITGAGLPDADVEAILHGNAERLLGIGG